MSASEAAANNLGGGGGGGGGGGDGEPAGGDAYAEEDYGEGGEGAGDDLEAELAALEAMTEEADIANAAIQQTAESAAAGAADVLADKAKREEEAKERDTKSVFVTNVHWEASGDELAEYFASCGTVMRASIVMDKHKTPKGCVRCGAVARGGRPSLRPRRFPPPPTLCLPPPPFCRHHPALLIPAARPRRRFAYVEFDSLAGVDNALILSGTEFKGRVIKVIQKRTNVPAYQLRGRGRGGADAAGGRGGRGRGRGRGAPFMGMPFMPFMGAPFMAAAMGGFGWGGRGRGGFRGAPRGAPRGAGGASYRGRGGAAS
jgi:polyadenylate-binding protein 2